MKRSAFFPGLLLFLIVAGVFLPAGTHDFITYDDPVYVTKNSQVQAGLSWANVQWAFLSTTASNWHPLTWLSHMLDCQLYGLHPGGHHLTNVWLHALSTGLLFAVLFKMTGRVWRSWLVAALFGLHPLHVESVAWIAERKDVLSTVFLMLTLWAYAHRAELMRARAPGSGKFNGLALGSFALGLMSKPMLVTLPCVLLLLDFWPLHRWTGTARPARWKLFAEKIPFFVLSAASSAITLFAQGKGGAVASVEDFTWPVRLGNALIAYCRYLGKCFFPTRLAVFYPNFAEQPPFWEIALALVLLAGITAAAVHWLRNKPYFLVGWLWFLGTLVPVIGLVQVGGQSMADRYSYVPLIGIFIVVVWTLGDALVVLPRWRPAVIFASTAALLGSTVLTFRQLSFWENGVTLFRHAVEVTEDNYLAHASLFTTLAKTSPAEAEVELQQTRRILADFAGKFERRGIALAQQPGREAEAIKQFRTAVRIMRDLPGPHYNLGLMLAQTPATVPEAIAELQTVVHLAPDFAEAHFALGLLLADTPGRTEEALGHFRAALKSKPDYEPAREMIRRLQVAAGVPMVPG